MKKKILKIFVCSILLVSALVLPVLGATNATYGTYGINGGYSLGDAPILTVDELNQESNLRGDKGSQQISLHMILLINGADLDSIYSDLQRVRSGTASFNDFFRFGDGTWYQGVELDLVELRRGERQQVFSINSLKNVGSSYSYHSFSSSIYVELNLKYRMKNEVPSLYYFSNEGLNPDAKEFENFVNVDYNPVDLALYSDKYNGQNVYCFIDSANVSLQNTANYYGVQNGTLPYDVHVFSNLCVPYGIAQSSPTSSGTINVSSKIGYSFNGVQGLTDMQQYAGSFRSTESNPKRFVASSMDFSLAKVLYRVTDEFYNGEYGVGIPIYMRFIVNSPTNIQKQYKPYIGVFEVVDRQRVSMDVGGTVSDSYDFSHLYRKIGFSLPPIDPWYSFFTVEYLTNFIMELVNLLTSLVWNLIVWIMCESPLLSDITSPLFLAGLEAGSIFTTYILPFVTALGLFTPVIVICIILRFVRSNK